MRSLAAALVAGVVFGLGLALSQMVNPAKVLGFLDVAGDWDPSLALVMGGALCITIPAFRLAGGSRRPLLSGSFRLPEHRGVDARLLAGAALFGVGWGLVGLCPGPALAALPIAGSGGVVFAVSLVVGTLAGRRLSRLSSDAPPET